MVYVILGLIGILTGILAGLFGFGGGFVIVPVVYHLFPAYGLLDPANSQYAMQIGVATSTSVMIVGTVYATFKHHRAGNIDWKQVLPLAWYIAIGSALGAIAASIVHGTVLHIAFILYVAAVIADCMLRKGFVTRDEEQQFRPMSSASVVGLGVIIGAVASLLGVGGSVMTVPLMRRHGARMKSAVALANPLSFPVAIVGTLTYVLMAERVGVDFGPGYLGFIYLPAFALLSAFSVGGVEFAVRALPRISDRVHAFTYVGLLAVVFVTMLF